MKTGLMEEEGGLREWMNGEMRRRDGGKVHMK